mgnify:CR=1 FL=1
MLEIEAEDEQREERGPAFLVTVALLLVTSPAAAPYWQVAPLAVVFAFFAMRLLTLVTDVSIFAGSFHAALEARAHGSGA